MFHGDFSIVELDAKEWSMLMAACDFNELDKCVGILKAAIEAGKSTEVDV